MKTSMDLLQIIREQGSRKSQQWNKDHSILCGRMTGRDTCEVEGLGKFEKDELLFVEIMTKKTLTELDFKVMENGGETHSHEWKDQSRYIAPLQEGDMVALVPFCDRYLVLGRVVEP